MFQLRRENLGLQRQLTQLNKSITQVSKKIRKFSGRAKSKKFLKNVNKYLARVYFVFYTTLKKTFVTRPLKKIILYIYIIFIGFSSSTSYRENFKLAIT